jgi:predicted mannosyl-3-phosphoglycerate phosphatase (HAD superfamily)
MMNIDRTSYVECMRQKMLIGEHVGTSTYNDVELSVMYKYTHIPSQIVAMTASRRYVDKLCRLHPGVKCGLLRSQEEYIMNAIKECIEYSSK